MVYRRNKKGDSASNAGAFLAIITVLIIMYILFLPPAEREKILGDNKTTFNLDSPTNTNSLLKQTIGRVNFISLNQKSYDIPTVRIYSPTSAQLIKAVPSISIRSALFDHTNEVFSADFDIDKSATKDIILAFNVKDSSGILIITLNGRTIFNSAIKVSNAQPITLDSGYLTDKNTITFSVQKVGWNFWAVNKYSLENVQITGEVTDYQNSISAQYFTLSDAEKNNLDTVRLYFNPVCTINEAGPLTIELNKVQVFKGIADCGTRTNIPLDNGVLIEGSNELKFSTTKGSYLIDNINVKVNVKKPTTNIYYFDLSNDIYFKSQPETARCGDYDNTCPPGCSDVQDADCCFDRSGLWCGVPTSNSNDRCVYYVDASDCGICKTGYYDSNGDAPNNCENKCGDNNDGVCPSGCNVNQDADCCFTANQDNFWCKEVPFSGISDRCRLSVNFDDCNKCASGYEDKGGSSPDSCSNVNPQFVDSDFELTDDYDVRLTVKFVQEGVRKRVDINVNGHKVSIDTTAIDYKTVIDQYVRKGTNSIEIVPREDVDIAELNVDVIKVR